jgi:hypothetical protein
MVIPHRHIPDPHHRPIALERAARKLERFGDADDLSHPGQKLDLSVIKIGLNANGAQNCLPDTRGPVHVKSVLVQNFDDLFDLFFAYTGFSNDDHRPEFRIEVFEFRIC